MAEVKYKSHHNYDPAIVMAGLTKYRITGKKVVDKIDGVYYSEMVRRIIGYMVTWTTYGTRLQGEKKGYVKNGKILAQNDKLKSANQRHQKYPTVKLNSEQKQIVENTIIEEAQRINHKIFAIAAC
jgi:hypothetical protein